MMREGCKKHPRYTGELVSRVPCLACDRIYLARRVKQQLDKARIALDNAAFASENLQAALDLPEEET